MVIGVCSLVQHCFGLAVVDADIVDEGTADEDIVQEKNVYEETDFLNRNFFNQETKGLPSLIGVPRVSKS